MGCIRRPYARRGSALNANDTRVSAITLTLGVTDRASTASSLRLRVESPKDPFAPPVRTRCAKPARGSPTSPIGVIPPGDTLDRHRMVRRADVHELGEQHTFRTRSTVEVCPVARAIRFAHPPPRARRSASAIRWTSCSKDRAGRQPRCERAQLGSPTGAVGSGRRMSAGSTPDVVRRVQPSAGDHDLR